MVVVGGAASHYRGVLDRKPIKPMQSSSTPGHWGQQSPKFLPSLGSAVSSVHTHCAPGSQLPESGWH